jgi:two-component system chemotaxis response regulator CheB
MWRRLLPRVDVKVDMAQISVLVVDDSVVVRRLVTSAIEGEADMRVVGTAPNGKIALAKLDQVAPDVVTLDIEMPELDGLGTLRALRRTHPRLPVIMFSTLTQRGAAATLEALASGASDYVTKPANVGSVNESIQRVREQLVPKIRALHGAPLGPGGRRPRLGASATHGTPGTPAPVRPRSAQPAVRRPRPAPTGPAQIRAIGCSTGGPEALSRVLTALPADLPVPVVVVQHMPPLFTKLFADRLDRSIAVHVVEAADGEELRPGTVYIAPGDYHLEIVRDGDKGRTRLQQGPPENFCRPAVDVLFRSVASAYGAHVAAAVLTGMGTDGRRGCESLLEAGAGIIAQDEATSVVWGMPGAVAQAGLADAVLPIDDIADALLAQVARRPALATRRA